MATLGQQVGPAEGDVPSPPTSINEPFIEGGDSTEARVDLPHASDTIETDVEATPDMRPPPAMKRKHSEKAGGIGQHKKSRASFSLRALKQAMGLASGSSRPSSLLPRTTNPQGHSGCCRYNQHFLYPTPPSPSTQAIFEPSSSTSTTSIPTSAALDLVSSIAPPLLSEGVKTASVLTNMPSPSSALPPSAPTVLTLIMPSSFSCPSVSLDQVYTS